MKGTLLRPREFFRAESGASDLRSAVLWFLACGWLGGAFAYLYEVSDVLGSSTPAIPDPLHDMILASARNPDRARALLVGLDPLLLLVQSVLYALVVHGLLRFFGGATATARATLRALLYAQTSAFVLLVVPKVGFVLGMIWSFVFTIVGVAETHRAHPGRVVPAVVGAQCALGAAIFALVGLLGRAGTG